MVQHQKNIIALRDKTIEDQTKSLSFYRKWFWILLVIVAGYVGVRYVLPRYIPSR